MRGRMCFKKLVAADKEKEREINENHGEDAKNKVSSGNQHNNESNPNTPTEKVQCRRRPTKFTTEEDENLKMGVKKFGLFWSKILHDPELKFDSCRFPNTLRKRAKVLNLI